MVTRPTVLGSLWPNLETPSLSSLQTSRLRRSTTTWRWRGQNHQLFGELPDLYHQSGACVYVCVDVIVVCCCVLLKKQKKMFLLTNVIVCAFLYWNTGLYPGPEMPKNILCEYSWETCDELRNRYNATLLF